MYSDADLPRGRGFPIRTSADQRSLASPRGFSQRATSFIASWRQGIHRTPFSCSTTPATAHPRAGHKTPHPGNHRSKPERASTLYHSQNEQTHNVRRPPHNQPIRFTCQTTQHAQAPPPHRRQHPEAPMDRAGHPRRSQDPQTEDRRQTAGTAKLKTPRTPGHPTQDIPHEGDILETVGIEPTTPCLQSRCSPTELRPPQPQQGRTMGQGGLEPPTPRLSSVCSNQLSYWPTSQHPRATASAAWRQGQSSRPDIPAASAAKTENPKAKWMEANQYIRPSRRARSPALVGATHHPNPTPKGQDRTPGSILERR